MRRHMMKNGLWTALILLALVPATTNACDFCAECSTVPPGALICGCQDVPTDGEIRNIAVSGAVDDTVSVMIKTTTVNLVDTVGFDVHFDQTMLTYVLTTKTDLTGSWVFFQGTVQPDGETVIVGGFDPSPIMIGADGGIAEMRFVIKQAGCTFICITNPREALSGYTVCSNTTSSVDVPAVAVGHWGEIKSFYR